MTIIDLNTQMSLKPVRTQGFCRCQRVFVDKQTRMLRCQKCDRVIDPFDYLWQQAIMQEGEAMSLKGARHEHERLDKEIEELKRQKRNLQAQVRRLKKKETEDEHGATETPGKT